MREALRVSPGVVAGAATHQDFMKIELLPRELRIGDQDLRELDPLARKLEAAK